MKTRWTIAVSAVVLFLLSGLAFADEVRTDYDHNADFSQFHTYSWGQVKTPDPFYVDRIKHAVDQQLQSKGWQLVPDGGQITVFALGNVRNQREVETMYNGFGPGWRRGGFGESTRTTLNQPVGKLVIDLFGNGRKLLFRGISTRDMSDKSDKNIKALNKDVEKMFKNFPPKTKG